MTKQFYDQLTEEWRGFRLLPGRCLIHLDQVPDKIGSVIVPDSARVRSERTQAFPGTVLKVRYNDKEWLPRGDFLPPLPFLHNHRVLVNIHLDELHEEIILARNDQVIAILT